LYPTKQLSCSFLGDNVPEFGDHGGIIVLINTYTPTYELTYTLNEGLTWLTCVFTSSNTPILLANARISSEFDSSIFLLHGTRNGKAVFVSVDFTDVFDRDCNASDYESWSPTNEHDNCLVGYKTNYLRRKRESICLNGMDHDIIISKEPCNCTYEDYECDFCFERDYVYTTTLRCTFACVVDQKKISTLPKQGINDCQNGQLFYAAPVGVRKIDGDGCIGNVSLLGYIPCSFPNITSTTSQNSATPSSSNTGITSITSQINDANLTSIHGLIDDSNPYQVSFWDIVLIVTCVIGTIIIVGCLIHAKKQSDIGYSPVQLDPPVNNPIDETLLDESDGNGDIKLEEVDSNQDLEDDSELEEKSV